MYQVSKLIIHIDGSSQGNPGPSGVGGVFESGDGKKLLEISKYIGEGTNNRAEYQALITALTMLSAKHLNWLLVSDAEILIKTDSELLYNQVNGDYKVKDWVLKKLHSKVIGLQKVLPKFKMVLIPREKNRVCDRLAKRAIKDALEKYGIKPKDKNIRKAQRLFAQ